MHGSGDGGTGHEVGPVFRKQHALANGIDRVPGVANALHATGHGRRRSIWMTRSTAPMSIPSSSVDVAQEPDPAGFQLFLDDRALIRGQRAMVRARDRFTGQIVQRTGQPFGHRAAVNEKNRRVTLANEFKETRMNCVPDGNAARCLRSGPALGSP